MMIYNHEYNIELQRVVHDDGPCWVWLITDDGGDCVHTGKMAMRTPQASLEAAIAYLKAEGLDV